MNKRAKIRAKSGGFCWYCGEELPDKGWHADHFIPKRRGGPDDIDNMVPACAPCNLFKRTYSINGLRRKLSRQVDRGLKTSINMRMALKFGQIKLTKKPIKFWFELNEEK